MIEEYGWVVDESDTVLSPSWLVPSSPLSTLVVQSGRDWVVVSG